MMLAFVATLLLRNRDDDERHSHREGDEAMSEFEYDTDPTMGMVSADDFNRMAAEKDAERDALKARVAELEALLREMRRRFDPAPDDDLFVGEGMHAVASASPADLARIDAALDQGAAAPPPKHVAAKARLALIRAALEQGAADRQRASDALAGKEKPR